MYTPGYLPSQEAILDGVKAYKNAIGINIHACHKIHLTNSLFSDNFMGVDLERSEDLTVSDTTIIGESPSYRQLMIRQNVRSVCLRNKMTGLQLGTWQNKFGPGYMISNVTFSSFKGASCLRSAIVGYDDIVSFEANNIVKQSSLPIVLFIY
jgi:nitrous oxidase accessory protein NosD